MSTDALFAAQRTLTVLLPEIVLIVTAVVMMTAGAFVRAPRWAWSITSTVALLIALAALLALRHTSTDAVAYGAVALNDALSVYARLGLLLAGLILIGLAHDQVDEGRAAEFFGAILLIHAGSMLVAASNELVLLFAGLELVSIPTYLLLYLPRRTPATQEAATKYFYLSIFSSALLLFGLAYLYGLTGVSNLKALTYLLHADGAAVGASGPPLAFGLIALLFVVAGLGFRVAAVPFHFYAPDVYQGSPTVIAALLAWVPKALGFLAMLRVLTAVMGGTGELADRAVLLAWILAVVTMTLGNTVALLQDDLKRLLAYSSIAHAGYLLIGVAVAFRDVPEATATLGGQAILFYLAAYALMTLGAFGVILALSTPERPVETIDQLVGLGRTRPFAALAMALCLLSLTGVPPLAGFWGKLYLFAAALGVQGTEEDTRLFTSLAIIGVLNAAIGAYYYLRIVVYMYLRNPDPNARPIEARPPWATQLAVGACAGLSLLVGLLPGPIATVSREATVAALALPDPTPGPEGTDEPIPKVALAPSAR